MKNTFKAAFVGTALLFIGCHNNHHEEHESSTFTVVQPAEKDTVLYKEYVAQIRAHKHIELRAIEQGYLEQISVDEGARVSKGDLMFTTLPSIYQAELNKAKSIARVAEIEYSNALNLFRENIISDNELALFEAEYEKAKAEVNLSETHLNFSKIKAPFDGIMDRLLVREGSLLDEGEILTSLSDNSTMWVYFNVPEAEDLNYIQHLEEQQKQVSLLLPNGSTFDGPGTIDAIMGEFDNTTGTIGFRASFKNPNSFLRHGETGDIIIPIPFTKALLIPQKATFQILDKTYVFKVSASGEVTQTEITVKGELPDLFIVGSGLSSSDQILVDGIRLVKNHQIIEARSVPFDKLAKELNLFSE
ncbi:MAG: efflux RND transporter periplasmic adaptor subunit [Flavobacteriaceae bacterium]